MCATQKIIQFLLFSSTFLLGECQDDEQQEQEVKYLSNLSKKCLDCLCNAATGCDMTLGCIKGYCGSYKISRLYWIDADREVLREDDVERAGAFEDCALQLACAQRIVINYYEKYARDCNEDGVTDCTDYLMLNFNGGYQCNEKLSRNEAGKNFTKRFEQCYYK